MAPRRTEAPPNAVPGDPKHAARATRTAGRQMRSRLLDAASRLFRDQGLAGASISDIAAAADAFPSQITYYFRTKEALFVEAACRELLYLARAIEQAALKARTPQEYTRALAETATASDSVAFFAEALTLTRRRQDLAPLVERTIERLHAEGARAFAGQVERHGWSSLCEPEATSRQFWAVSLRGDGRRLRDGPFAAGTGERIAAGGRSAGDDDPGRLKAAPRQWRSGSRNQFER